ncbi:MAG: hypothetical protein FWC87_00725 [Acidimicrobiaceae bacterium]|nr:hypothetical protein [Acidimicrobiaceae bacterium]
MGVLDKLKGLVGGRKGRANRGVGNADKAVELEVTEISPRLRDVDSGQESELDIERDRRL